MAAFVKIIDDYRRAVKKAKLKQRDQLEVYDAISLRPDEGTPVKDAGILRKLRVKFVSRRIGKRGGLRVIYYFDEENNTVWPLDVYFKGEKEDLTADERRNLQRKARSL